MTPQIGITEFRVKGLVVERETQAPLPGLRIKAFDRELRYTSKLLATATTDSSGAFEFRLAGHEFQEILSARPDLYFQVIDAAGKIIYTTPDSVPMDPRKEQIFRVEIPLQYLPSPGEHGID